MILHLATCPAWASGDEYDCSCIEEPAWLIRKDSREVFAWQIYRRTPDSYEPLMRCSTFEGARQLVVSLMWLSRNRLRRSGV